MAQPVWVLSVDLQTKTATFQSGLADAAKAARTSFRDISSSAGEMGEGVSKGSIDIRHSLGLVDNVIRGAHAQAMADLIRMYAQSALVMTALPIAATAAGLALIGGIVYEVAEKMEAAHAAQEKLTDDQTKFGTAVNDAFRSLEDRILSAAVKADELRNDHLGALKAQLQIIDNQSMDELVKSLETVAKASDEVFKDLQAHWYNFGTGSLGAQHALTEFQVQYNNLLSQGKDADAGNLLAGTLASAQKIKTLQESARSTKGSDYTDTSYAAQLQLRQLSAGYTDKEYEAQVQLVQALQTQVGLEGKVNELKKLDSANTTRETGNEIATQKAAAARQSAESQLKMGESAIAADRAQADAQLTIKRASIEARLSSDLDFAGRELAVQQAGNAAEIAALDKSGKDYTNQLQALQGKALEITAEHDRAVSELTAKAAEETAARSLEALQSGERQKIDATQEGSAARLAAITAAIQEEEAAGLKETSFYRDLLNERVQATRQEAEEEKRIALEVMEVHARSLEQTAQEQGRHLAEMLQLQHGQGGGDPAALERINLERQQMNLEYQLKRDALQKQLQPYRDAGTAQVKQAQQTQAQIDALDREHADRSDELLHQQQQSVRTSLGQIASDYASTFMQIAEGHEHLSQTMIHLAQQSINSMVKGLIMLMTQNEASQLSYAKTAAAGAYAALSGIPFVGPALGAVAAAGVFAGALAFETGGIVPGVGRGDIVPAMLTPGEAVIPKRMTEMLTNAANSSDTGGAKTYHMHIQPTYHVQALDGDGLRTVLDKHSDQLHRHFEQSLRRMNR